MKRMAMLIGVFIIILPITSITYVSYLEIQKYKPKTNYILSQVSYGEPKQIMRTNLEENLLIKGKFISKSYKFIDVKNNDVENIKTTISVNDEVKKGDILFYLNSKPVYSNVNGIICELDLDRQNGYIKLLDIDNLLFESYVSLDNKLELNKTYIADENIKIKLVSLSNIINEQGRKDYFKVDGNNFFYGQEAEFKLKTGLIYTDVLAVDKHCVYQKEDGGPYYIRRVEADGTVIGEIEVKVGNADESMILISGVKEGWYCDSGYAKFINSNKR